MIRFLIHRPIAVTMTFIAIMIVGIGAAITIPVSLMPAIDIPEITIQVNRKNVSARELENTVVVQLRRQLSQVTHLTDIQSETRDELATIRVQFAYGTHIDLAFIEVNEKIDRIMSLFPRDVERPKVIKTKATDIPVFYLNVTLKDRIIDTVNVRNHSNSYSEFSELSDFALQVIKRRLEQLSDVAMVDISGLQHQELLVVPDLEKLQSLNITLDQLETQIRNRNVNLGNLLIHDGQYEYNIRVNSNVREKKDIEDIYFNTGGHIIKLKEFAAVIQHPQKRKGMVISDGKPAITMAIIKQSDAQLGELEKNLAEMVGYFNYDYPRFDFTVTRDQTKLLDYSISNLEQDLTWGGLLAFLVLFVFLKDIKSPLLIGVTLPASLIVSLIFFYLLDISINIISLSGLVLGVGMMIDNSIIVIDNISQFRKRNLSLSAASVGGANEVFIPMLSSVMTTGAVFIPLIYISGISGALFYDEAMSVIIGAFVSLIISVTIIPVYYRLFYLREQKDRQGWWKITNLINYAAIYERSFKYILRHQKSTWAFVILLMIAGMWAYSELPKSKLPKLTKDDVILELDWNEKINVEENNERVEELIKSIDHGLFHHTAWIGEQQFILNHKTQYSASEALLYLKAEDENTLNEIQRNVNNYIGSNFPTALFKYRDADNVFNFIFSDDEPPLVANLRATKDIGDHYTELLVREMEGIREELPNLSIQQVALQEHVVLRADPVKMITYDINPESLYAKLKAAFNAREIFYITNGNDFIPIVLGDRSRQISEILADAFVYNSNGKLYPIRELVSQVIDYDLKTIVAGSAGEYYPVAINVEEALADSIMNQMNACLAKDNLFEIEFTGNIFSSKRLIGELTIILLISVALLYIILATQFESLILPLIVLLEIPIDILAAFIFLKLFGSGINLMSLIGIVVMSGIIINDSILKIDTINQLVRQGNSLIKAIYLGGQRRLKPILMTGITTVLAMIPLLFTPGLGSELQRPLAIALLGGMTIGTIVSLYIIPLCYYYMMKKKKNIRGI